MLPWPAWPPTAPSPGRARASAPPSPAAAAAARVLLPASRSAETAAPPPENQSQEGSRYIPSARTNRTLARPISQPRSSKKGDISAPAEPSWSARAPPDPPPSWSTTCSRTFSSFLLRDALVWKQKTRGVARPLSKNIVRNKRQAGCCVGSNEDGGSQIMMITLLITTVFSSKTPARCGHASDVWIKLTRQEMVGPIA